MVSSFFYMTKYRRRWIYKKDRNIEETKNEGFYSDNLGRFSNLLEDQFYKKYGNLSMDVYGKKAAKLISIVKVSNLKS